MGWAQRANMRAFDGPKPRVEKKHFKEPEHKRWWALFLERIGVPIRKTRVKAKTAKAPWRTVRYQKVKHG